MQIDLPVTAHLPRDYIARDDVRMEAYRRLAAVTTAADVDDVLAEWTDRYGPPPPPAAVLLDVARLRAACLRARDPRGVGAEGPGPPRRVGAAQVAGGAAASALSDRSQVLPDAVIVPVSRDRGRLAPAGAAQVARRDRSSAAPIRSTE